MLKILLDVLLFYAVGAMLWWVGSKLLARFKFIDNEWSKFYVAWLTTAVMLSVFVLVTALDMLYLFCYRLLNKHHIDDDDEG